MAGSSQHDDERRRVAMSTDNDALLEAIWAWDPIGVNDVRSEVPHEYDDLHEHVARFLRTRPTVIEFESSVRTYVRERLGLAPQGVEDFVDWASSTYHLD